MAEPINININDGEAIFSHETTVNFTPTQLMLDFKCITPRTDPRSKKPIFHIKHNVVMLDPWQAKALHEVLNNVISRYEKEFGKIKKPKAVEKAEKKTKTVTTSKVSAPTYFG